MKTKIREIPKAPLGEYFWVKMQIEGDYIVCFTDGPDKRLKPSEMSELRRLNTELDTNDWMEMFPPVQVAGIGKQTQNSGVLNDFVLSAFNDLKTQIADLRAEIDELKAKRGPGRPRNEDTI